MGQGFWGFPCLPLLAVGREPSVRPSKQDQPNLSPFYSLLSLAHCLTRNESFTLSGPPLSHPLLRKFGDGSLSSGPFCPDSLWSWWHRNTEAQLGGGSLVSPRWPVALPGLVCFSKQEYDVLVTHWSLSLEVSVSPSSLAFLLLMASSRWVGPTVWWDIIYIFPFVPISLLVYKNLEGFRRRRSDISGSEETFWALAEERLTDPFFFFSFFTWNISQICVSS